MTNYNSGFSPITNFLTDSVNYGKVGELAVKDYLSQQNTAMAADGLVEKTGIEADKKKKIAGHEAKALIARGAAKESAAIWQGVGQAAGSVGSGIVKGLGNNSNSYFGTGSTPTDGSMGKYGSFKPPKQTPSGNFTFDY